MKNAQCVPIFTSFVDRLAAVNNSHIGVDYDVINQDSASRCSIKILDNFLSVNNSFDLIQTYSFIPENDEKWGQDVVDSFLSNDYKAFIKNTKVQMNLEKPTAIQVILDAPIQTDNETLIQGGILFANPKNNGEEAEILISLFTSEGGFDLGIIHLECDFQMKKMDGETVFSFENGLYEMEVDEKDISRLFLMQIPYYLALKQSGYEEAYTHEAMISNEESHCNKEIYQYPQQLIG
jgi:hypothetical protein